MKIEKPNLNSKSRGVLFFINVMIFTIILFLLSFIFIAFLTNNYNIDINYAFNFNKFQMNNGALLSDKIETNKVNSQLDNLNLTGDIQVGTGIIFENILAESTIDDSIYKFVSKGFPFNDLNYKPNDLSKLKTTDYILVINTKGNGYHLLRKQAKENLEIMAKDFYEYFGEKIIVYSAYRSFEYQKYNISSSCKKSGWCAKEGESEHQSGLAVDLWEGTNNEKFLKKYQKYYDWLNENSHKYGFHQSYKNGIEIDNYHIEPWHWRYLGIDLATHLHDLGLTYTQYINND